jgi:hypothetical protein
MELFSFWTYVNFARKPFFCVVTAFTNIRKSALHERIITDGYLFSVRPDTNDTIRKQDAGVAAPALNFSTPGPIRLRENPQRARTVRENQLLHMRFSHNNERYVYKLKCAM